MFAKLDGVSQRFAEIEAELVKPDLSRARLRELSQERASLEEIVTVYRAYQRLLEEQSAAEEMLRQERDAELKALAKEELDNLHTQLNALQQQLTRLLLPKDPNDKKNVLLEIRAGTGGEEASLFAVDLFRMYQRYADRMHWRTEQLSATWSANGGFKELIVLVSGKDVFSRLKFEQGVHRVQRVPVTESQGRIHTSACTVAVMPEADDIDIKLDPTELDISVCRASGAGGQHVNTTDSAVRIVHKPSGLVVECQDERSQHKNRARALKILQARLLEKAEAEQRASLSADRKQQVGSGDRSEKIRTYNFPQRRFSDHRINLTLYRLEEIMNGDLQEIIDALHADHTARLLQH